MKRISLFQKLIILWAKLRKRQKQRAELATGTQKNNLFSVLNQANRRWFSFDQKGKTGYAEVFLS